MPYQDIYNGNGCLDAGAGSFRRTYSRLEEFER
jgi:hypothetical protein